MADGAGHDNTRAELLGDDCGAVIGVKGVCVCGHAESEHRAEVLPFAACHHLDGEHIETPGVFGVAYSAFPCWCPRFRLYTGDFPKSPPSASNAEILARSAGEPGGRQPAIRLGAYFGPGEGKRYLVVVEYPFDGTPEGFDRAFERCRVAYHEAARERVRPCGFEGPWVEATSVEVASESPVGL